MGAASALAFALAISVAGCALIRSHGAAAPVAESPAVANLTAALAARDGSLHAMRSGAIMDFSSADGRHFRTHEQVALMRPASIRVEALSPFGTTMLLAADGARIQIFDPSKNTIMIGAANAATLDRYVNIPLAPASAVDLLMGLAPAEITAAPNQSESNREGMTVLSSIGPGGESRELGFVNGELAMVREREAGGAIICQVRYSDYRMAGAINFPHTVAAEFPSSKLTVRYDSPELNPALAASLFVLTPGPATREVTIGAVAIIHGSEG